MSRRARIVLVVTAAAVAVAAGAVAGAATSQCLPPVCQPGQRSGCCTEPPCGFMSQIRMKRAAQNFFLRAAERNGVGCGPGSDEGALNRERAALEAELQRTLADRNTQNQIFGSCSDGLGNSMPSFSVDEGCRVMVNGQPSSREGAHQRSSACKEFVDAAYDHERVHKSKCEGAGSMNRRRQQVGDYALEEVQAHQQEINSLASQLAQWARSCSKTPAGKDLAEQLKKLERPMKNTEDRRTRLENQAAAGSCRGSRGGRR